MEVLKTENGVHTMTVGAKIHVAGIPQEAIANISFHIPAWARPRSDITPFVRIVAGGTSYYPGSRFMSLVIEDRAMAFLTLRRLTASHADPANFNGVSDVGWKLVACKFSFVMTASTELFLRIFTRP